MLLSSGLPTAASGSEKAGSAERKALVKILKKRGVTAQIDLPMRKGMRVTADGRIDLAVYRQKLTKLPPSIKKHEHARIRRIDIDDRRIRVVLNFGGLEGLANPDSHAVSGRDPSEYAELGTTIVIDSGRPLVASDLQAGRVARVLRDVILIDGLEAAVRTAQGQPRQPPVVRERTPPTVHLFAVEVLPARVRRGQPVELIVRFNLTGGGLGGVRVDEMRQLLFEEKPVFPAPRERSQTWLDGLHSSSFEMVVPETAPPGLYRFQGGIVVDGTDQTREVLFEVLPE